MNTATKLVAYGVTLAVVAGGGYLVGSAVGPLTGTPASLGQETMASAEAGGHSHSSHSHSHSHSHGTGSLGNLSSGLASSVAGYTLAPTNRFFSAGVAEEFAFRITRLDGTTVTAFDVEHDKRMHVIIVRRDGRGYQHLHPEMDPDGTWRVPLTFAEGGSYRAFADFVPAGGAPATLGVDLEVSGRYAPVASKPAHVASLDGYQVDLAGELVPGQTSELTLTVRRDGAPVTDLQPYLAAYGHLVALREGDLAYVHVHPHGNPGDGHTQAGPAIRFAVKVPSAGTYRLYFDFQHNNVVRTAEFTVPTGSAATKSGIPDQPAQSSHPPGEVVEHGAPSGGEG